MLKFHIEKRTKLNFLLISLIVLCLDLFFVGINYYSNKNTLQNTLLLAAKEEKNQFQMTIDMTYRNMMQLALYISQDQSLNQLFLKGKKAIAREGGGRGGVEAQKARKALLNKVKPAWDKLTNAFDIRQLHYHLGPGSLSFLRVHKPSKYGDRMDNLRHIIVATNEEKTPRYGFETGRIYSGLRGVYPVWATDPDTKKKVYVGALETGTSFKQILPTFTKNYGTNVAVLLTKEHIEGKMWKAFIAEYFKKNPHTKYYLEATSSPLVNDILSNNLIHNNFKTDKVNVIKLDNQYWSVFYFPLHDYQSKKNSGKPGGFVLMWQNISNLMADFQKNFYINLIFAAIAFVIIELALLFILIKEEKYKLAQRQAIYDGLTDIYNRRYFDLIYKQAKEKSKKIGAVYAIILCDIDQFKSYNDSYGHQQGDICLKKVAHAIQNTIRRSSDLVCRYGGEEFVVFLSDATQETAERIAEQIRVNVQKLNLPHRGSTIASCVTISLGVAYCAERDDTNVLERADSALYQAKEQGRNRVVCDWIAN